MRLRTSPRKRSYWLRSIFADCAAPGAFLRFRARPLTFLPGVVADLAAPVRECYLWMLSAGQNERPQSGHTRTHQERAIVAALVFLDTARAGKGQRRGAPAAKSTGTTAKRGPLWRVRAGDYSLLQTPAWNLQRGPVFRLFRKFDDDGAIAPVVSSGWPGNYIW